MTTARPTYNPIVQTPGQWHLVAVGHAISHWPGIHPEVVTLLLRFILSGLVTTLFGSLAHSADIYQSVHSDGSVSFSTDASNKDYVLVSRGERNPIANPHADGSERDAASSSLTTLIEQTATRHGIDVALIHAIVAVESQFNSSALSPKGAFGAMQLMPATARRYGVSDKTDPAQNIDAGVRYLKDLLRMHHDNLPLALAAYNSGEGSVSRHGRRIPPYRETMLYVPAVLARVQAYRAAHNL